MDQPYPPVTELPPAYEEDAHVALPHAASGPSQIRLLTSLETPEPQPYVSAASMALGSPLLT